MCEGALAPVQFAASFGQFRSIRTISPTVMRCLCVSTVVEAGEGISPGAEVGTNSARNLYQYWVV